MTPTRSPIPRRLAGLAGAVAVSALVLSVQAAPADAAGPVRGEGSARAIKNSYVVVLDDAKIDKAKPQRDVDQLAGRYGAQVRFRYGHALRGFSATMTPARARALAANPKVSLVQQDQTVSLAATQSPTPSWGLDRIDQRDLPLNGAYTYPSTGAGVTAYVIDTGIRTSHSDFGGRAVWGTNTAGDGNDSDCNGHGTHVAGTVGGTSYGVAKGVRLVAVKVLNCQGSGSTAGVVAGIDWVTGNHVSGPAVANMSLGGGADSALDAAVTRSIADGVVYAVASGNSGADACTSSPARVRDALTVNASTTADARASYSNYGTCTDLFAPGSGITSAWNTSDVATNTISGTSMATPHVAGAAALVLAANPTATPATVAATLLGSATTGKITNPGTGSPNRLLDVAPTTAPPAGCPAVSNGTDVPIRDLTTSTSSVVVSGCSGTASATTTVEVHIVHTYRGDLVVDLVAPDGSVTNLLNRSGGSADDVDQTFTVNRSSVPANGTWTLRVRDAASADTGYLNSWTLDP